MLLGGYVVHPEVGEDEMRIFNKALEGHVGYGLKPVAVASQLVAGYNYLFLCTGAPVVPDPETQLCVVKIFVKLPCNPGPDVELKEIKEIDVGKLEDAYRTDAE